MAENTIKVKEEGDVCIQVALRGVNETPCFFGVFCLFLFLLF